VRKKTKDKILVGGERADMWLTGARKGGKLHVVKDLFPNLSPKMGLSEGNGLKTCPTPLNKAERQTWRFYYRQARP